MRSSVFAGAGRVLLSAGLCLMLSGCFGGVPRIADRPVPFQNLGHDWRRHFEYGLQLLEEDSLAANKNVLARAAFSSAARFSRDYAPAYVGLGIAEMALGNFAEAQIAFLNAALIDDRSMYWALSAIAALKNGDEIVARSLFDAMQAAPAQDDDPASRFVRAIYLPDDKTFSSRIRTIPYASDAKAADDELACEKNTRDEICRDLNIVANVYFVRRYSTDSRTRGTDFFNDLTVLLGASRTQDWQKENGSSTVSVLSEVSLSIPEIEYAVRLTPQNVNSSVYVNAAPSIVTSVGEESEIHEGSNRTILYNSTGYADEYTAETGMTLNLKPEVATPHYVNLKLRFEFSSIGTLEPSSMAQVLDVSKNTYTITGYFPYGKPIVLGTISSGTQKYDATGQSGLNRIPLVGGAFGKSEDRISASDTMVIGVLSEPTAFHGSRERRVLEAMRSMGVKIAPESAIERRKDLHRAPDIHTFGLGFLKAHVKSGTDQQF
ncbi:MAG: hypothetical protein WBG82_05315 [Parvibaculum sp.]